MDELDIRVEAWHRHVGDAAQDGADTAAPERHAIGLLLGLALDQIDYGVILLDARHMVCFANYRARTELKRGQLLQAVGGGIRACGVNDRAALVGALAAAGRGLRQWIALGERKERIGVAVTPIEGFGGEGTCVMLTLARPNLCEPLTINGFAQAHGLTAAERRVLEALCGGEAPGMIARRFGVSLTTVRSQVSSIRSKTHSEGIDHLMLEIAKQPPLPCRLRTEPVGWQPLA